MRAWWELSSERRENGRTPWTAVQWWCEATGIDREDQRDFHFVCDRLDITYIEWLNKKQGKPAKKGPER